VANSIASFEVGVPAGSSALWGGSLASLALVSSRLHPNDIPAVVAEEAALLGAGGLLIYLSDLEQRLLVPFQPPGAELLEPLSIDGTVAGRAYRTQRRVLLETTADAGAQGAGTTVWLPLLDSSARIGVISVCVDAGVELDEAFLRQLDAISSLTAEIIANKADYGDVIARTRRTQVVSMAAEMRWSMLPPLTFTGRNLTISGVVEPAYEIAGDTFDYAVNSDSAHVAIIDAVGHSLEAARIANLAVVAYRHSRRRDLGLLETYRAMDRTLAVEFGQDKFATAQLATLTLATGELCWLNAGHPAPMLIRNGHHIDLVSEICLPIGLASAHDGLEPQIAQTSLEPGDLVLFFTDGVSEARSIDGVEFGRHRLGDLIVRVAGADQDPPETMRLLGHAVLAHQLGVLQDDATLLVLAGEGPPASARLDNEQAPVRLRS
jgi:hypothetical protein